MDRSQLLQHFDTLAETPDAVEKLRNLILDFAVRGRLVPQNSSEETAHALLKRVASAAKTRRGPDEPNDVNEPFRVPASWAWVRLPRVLNKLTDGTHHSPPNDPAGDFMYVTAKNIKTDGVLLDGITYVTKEVHEEIYSRCNPSFGDVLYIKDGATTGIATINQIKKPFSMLSSVALLKPSEAVFNRYLLWAMRSPFFYNETRGAMKGAAITRVTLSVMAASLLPLPPLAEQRRIVAKVEELLALCDELEARQTAANEHRTRLVRSALDHLTTAQDESEFKKHSTFVLEHSELLFDSVPALRQAILSLAVQGHLVEQDIIDEAATALMQKIKSERERLLKAGKTKKLNGQQDHKMVEAPCLLPHSWECAPLSALTYKITDGEHITPKRDSSGRYLLSARNVRNEGIDLSDVDFVPEDEYKRIRMRCDPDKGDILISCSGSVGRVAIVDHDDTYVMVRSAAFIKFPQSLLSARFLAFALRSPLCQQQIVEKSRTSAQSNLFLGRIGELIVPVPPLAEQQRIVAKVDELMRWCDALESRLTAAQTAATHLLDSTLHQILTA